MIRMKKSVSKKALKRSMKKVSIPLDELDWATCSEARAMWISQSKQSTVSQLDL